jgi:hypothetical protein
MADKVATEGYKTLRDQEVFRGMLIDIPLGERVQYAHEMPDGSIEQREFVMDLDAEVADDGLFEIFYDPRQRGRVHSVNHADRLAWLEHNGYELTRENMLNKRLPLGAVLDAASEPR